MKLGKMCSPSASPQHLAVLGQRYGVAQAGGQRPDAQGLPLFLAHGGHAARRRGLHRIVLLDAFHSRRQHDAEGEVGIAGRVGSAVFDPHRAFVTRLVGWHPDKVGPVDVRP